MGIIIEVKYAEGDMDAVCRKALAQIEEKDYAEELYRQGARIVWKYGIACSRKKCRVMCAGLEEKEIKE